VEAERLGGPDALDFWLGEWACSWDGGHGCNRVTRELNGRVVVERFESEAPERWSGMSVSVHDERRGWRQTWVDSTGNYWAFEGAPYPEGFAFSTTQHEDGRDVEKRMVFSEIGPDAFSWRWERSVDGADSWEVLWAIEYRREAGARQDRQGRGQRHDPGRLADRDG
jgi:hypothetical protein